MTYPEHTRRTIVLKTSRETLLLVTAACGMACALAYAVHSRPQPAPEPEIAAAPAQGWTGGLADLGASSTTTPEPMTSAALTVPKSQLALPIVPAKPAPKPRLCDGAPCAKAVAAPPPVRREVATRPSAEPRRHEASLASRMNPLNHIPDAVRRPFAYAGDAVMGWFKSF